MPLKLLATADLHLGRRPARLPEAVVDEVPARDLGPAGAWKLVVERALEEGVHALLLAGDVVEGDHDFFEAYATLREGVRRLLEVGVRVVAVAGNHDTRVLPALADELEGFELLGRGGQWERRTLSAGGEEVTLHGWSFSGEKVRDDPVAGRSFERGPGPNLGLLHGDRDQAGSPYAPVASRSLEGVGLDGWLLGHIHRPDDLDPHRPVGYLGSLTGLDPGEPGPRGPWLVTVERGQVAGARHLALAPLRWMRLTVDVAGIGAAEDARTRLLRRVEELDASLTLEETPPRAVGLRVVLRGRTGFGREVQALFEAEEPDRLPVGGGRIDYFVETLRVETEPERPLGELARQDDPAGLLARLLLALDVGDEEVPGAEEGSAALPDRAELVSQARRRLERVARDPVWSSLERGADGADETAEWLRRAGRRALERLLDQRGGTE